MTTELAPAQKERSSRFPIWQQFTPRDRTEAIVQKVQQQTAMYMVRAEHLGASPLGGRPTKYRPEFCALVFEMLTDNSVVFSLRFVAGVLGISPDTLYRWKRLHPGFADAIDGGKALQENWLSERLIFNDGNPKAILFLLKQLHGWTNNGKNQPGDRSDVSKLIRDVESARTVVDCEKLGSYHQNP